MEKGRALADPPLQSIVRRPRQLRSARAARLPVSLPVLPLPIVVPLPLEPEPLAPEALVPLEPLVPEPPLAPIGLPLPVVPLLALGVVVLDELLLLGEVVLGELLEELLLLGEVVLGVLLEELPLAPLALVSLDEDDGELLLLVLGVLPLAPLALVSLDEEDGELLLPLLPEAPMVPVEPALEPVLPLGDAVVEPLPLGDAALVPLPVVLLLLELWAMARPPNASAQDAASAVRVVLVVLIACSLLTAWEWWVATPASGAGWTED